MTQTSEIRVAVANYLEAIAMSEEQSVDTLPERPELDRSLDVLRREFIQHARAYADEYGIAFSTWREVGVDSATLRAAGITPS